MKNDKGEFKERVYRFALDAVAFVEQLPKGQFSKIAGDQLLCCATSIGANVVESQGASSRKDYTNFFSYALKSANETKFWVSLLRDSRKAEREASDELVTEVTEIANILAASILTLRSKK